MWGWLEVGVGNYVLVTESSLLNTGLTVGTAAAIVIDTGCKPQQGREIPERGGRSCLSILTPTTTTSSVTRFSPRPVPPIFGP